MAGHCLFEQMSVFALSPHFPSLPDTHGGMVRIYANHEISGRHSNIRSAFNA